MVRPRRWPLGLAAALIACGGGEGNAAAAQAEEIAGGGDRPAEPVCRVAGAALSLPEEVRETSGLARSLRDPGLFWTHNDRGNGPDLFAVDAEGRLVRRVRVVGAPATDWEDLEAGRCGTGSCLYVGDIGDNDAERERITVYRIPEPDEGTGEVGPPEALHARFPDGPRDAEALFALPSGDLFLVDKGRRQHVALYRYPAPQRPGEEVTLERVRQLFPEPSNDDDRVTAATATPDGRWVGIRTYRTLHLYPTGALLAGGPVEPVTVDLTPLSESQGEGLAMADDGTVWLSSEAQNRRSRPLWSRLECRLPGG